MADYCLADEMDLVELPDGLTYVDGACVACGFGIIIMLFLMALRIFADQPRAQRTALAGLSCSTLEPLPESPPESPPSTPPRT